MSKIQYIYVAFALLVIVVLVGMLIKVKEGFCYAAICGYMFPADGKVMTNLRRVRCSQPWHDCPNEFVYNGFTYRNRPDLNSYVSDNPKKRQIGYWEESTQREDPDIPGLPDMPGGRKKKRRFGFF